MEQLTDKMAAAALVGGGAGAGGEDDVFSNGGGGGSLNLHAGAQQATAAQPAASAPIGKGAELSDDQILEMNLDEGVDSQQIYSPEACVFVANLYQRATDEQLIVHIWKSFVKFGQVQVKVRRNPNNDMPFAFCQFTTFEDARDALLKGRGRIILGRPCRTEKCKACSFYIYRRDGQDMTEEEATVLLAPHGRIASTKFIDEQAASLLELSSKAVLVSFTIFDACRNVMNAFSGNDHYVVKNYATKPPSPPRRDNGRLLLCGPNERTTTTEYHQRTIFVENLPDTIVENQVKRIFDDFGRILTVKIKVKDLGRNTRKAYAFVEFDNTDSPQAAVHEVNGTFAPGSSHEVLKVEMKMANGSANGRANRENGFMTPQPDRRRHDEEHNTTGGRNNNKYEHKAGSALVEQPRYLQSSAPHGHHVHGQAQAAVASGFVSPDSQTPLHSGHQQPAVFTPMTPGHPASFYYQQLFSPFAYHTPIYNPNVYPATFSSPGYMMGGYPPNVEEPRATHSEPEGADQEGEGQQQDFDLQQQE